MSLDYKGKPENPEETHTVWGQYANSALIESGWNSNTKPKGVREWDNPSSHRDLVTEFNAGNMVNVSM